MFVHCRSSATTRVCECLLAHQAHDVWRSNKPTHSSSTLLIVSPFFGTTSIRVPNYLFFSLVFLGVSYIASSALPPPNPGIVISLVVEVVHATQIER